MTDSADHWDRPIPHWTQDPFAGRTTIHGLASDEVRSALHKHVRRGRVEQSIRAAIELCRTDAEHEAEMWRRLQVLAAEDVGLGDPHAIALVRACHEAADDTPPGSYDRMVFAAHAAGHLARSPKDPTLGEIMQLVLNEDLLPDIPDEALCIHTRRGQELGRTMEDWFRDGTQIAPEVEGRPRVHHERLAALYHRLDPSPEAG
jgi:replication-associated recombination protein RarA